MLLYYCDGNDTDYFIWIIWSDKIILSEICLIGKLIVMGVYDINMVGTRVFLLLVKAFQNGLALFLFRVLLNTTFKFCI